MAFLTDDDFRRAADRLLYISWVSEPNGDTVYFNRLGCAYTGHPPEANYGWSWVGLVHPDDAESARAGWAESTASAKPYRLTYRIRRHDGSFRLHAFRALAVHAPDGRILKWVGIAVDVDGWPPLEEPLPAAAGGPVPDGHAGLRPGDAGSGRAQATVSRATERLEEAHRLLEAAARRAMPEAS